MKIPEFHIPNVTFGKHEPRTHKPKADEMFATASSRHLKSFPSSRGKILWGQVLGFDNCSRLLLQIRTNQKARTQDGQTDSTLTKVSSKTELLKVRMFCAQKNQGFIPKADGKGHKPPPEKGVEIYGSF